MIRTNYKITETVKAEVRAYLKVEKKLIVKERLTAVSLYINGMIQSEVAKSIGRDRSFVGKAIRGYFREGIEALQERRGGDKKSKLTIEQREELAHIIKTTYPINAKGWDGQIIVALIEDKYQVKYSRDSIYYILRKLNISHKKAKKVDPKKSEEKIKIWKEDIKKNSVI